MRIVALLLLVFSTEPMLISAQHIPTYNNSRFDLIDRGGWRLYAGSGSQLEKTNLFERDIYRFIQERTGIWSIENEIIFSGSVLEKDDIWLELRGNFSSARLYINGIQLVNNGEYRDNGDIVRYAQSFVIQKIPSNNLKAGVNTVKLVFVNTDIREDLTINDIVFTPGEDLKIKHENSIFSSLFLSGFLLLAILTNLLLYFAYNGRLVFLLLALYFFCVFCLIFNEFYFWAYNPLVTTNAQINSVVFYISFLANLLLAAILPLEFGFSKKGLWFVVIGAVLYYVVIAKLTGRIGCLCFPMPAYACAISLWALYKKKPNSGLISLALIVLLLFSYLGNKNLLYNFAAIQQFSFVRLGVYSLEKIGVLLFALTMLFTVTKRIFLQNKALVESQLKSSRLENQLVRKHIQPHFLMNSLMSLHELIETAPEKASAMVSSLSKEFHLLAEMSNKQLIPLTDELRICRVHLEIMGHQQDASFELLTTGLDGNEKIPPAVIHTLIENGLTHGYAGKQNGRFELRKSTTPSEIKYHLFNDGNSRKKKPNQATSRRSGTGTKYIEARLEESYPGRWHFSCNPVENGWESVITIQKQ